MKQLKPMATAFGMLHLLLVFGNSWLQQQPIIPYAIRYALWLAGWALLAPIGFAPVLSSAIAESPAAPFFAIALNSMLWGVIIAFAVQRRLVRTQQL
ncbi:hypothetical protein [Lacipirellula sp.]|uniref:hypothetical protein n=1 Tax=Lacipirellula sp. TaxID=2691419 RepID=UPI003D119E7A